MPCYAYGIFNPNDIVTITEAVACGAGLGVQTCCNPGDFCLSNSTCFTPIAKKGGGILNGTGLSYDRWPYNYYTAGCTDPTYTDPQCSRQCCMFYSMWYYIPTAMTSTYSASDTCVGLFAFCSGTQWSCGCNDNSCVCGASLGCGNFTMPAPSALSTLASISGSVAVPWTSSSTAVDSTAGHPAAITKTYTSTTSALSTSALSSTSSKGATKIGIGIGVLLGILLLTFSFVALFLWRRSRKVHPPEPNSPNQNSIFGKAELPAPVLSEREIASKPRIPPAIHKPLEIDGTSRATAMSELPS